MDIDISTSKFNEDEIVCPSVYVIVVSSLNSPVSVTTFMYVNSNVFRSPKFKDDTPLAEIGLFSILLATVSSLLNLIYASTVPISSLMLLVDTTTIWSVVGVVLFILVPHGKRILSIVGVPLVKCIVFVALS